MSSPNPATLAGPVTYDIDPTHSSAHFSVRHLMISNVRGEFTKVSGTVVYDEKNPTASHVSATIATDSINTRDAQRDGHLKSADFLDTTQFPEITFESTEIKAKSDDEYAITGNLTIHGTTNEVTLQVEGLGAPVTDPWGNHRIGVTATTKINRKDFGLTWNQTLETGGLMVGNDVSITLDIEAVQRRSA